MAGYKQEESSLGIVIGIILLGLAVPLLYKFFAPYINAFLLQLSAYELQIFTLFSDEAKEAHQRIKSVTDPGTLTWQQMTQVMSYVGKYIRWPLGFLLLFMALIAFNLSRVSKFRRRLSMEKLIKNNAEIFSCLGPIVGRGNYLLSPESYDSGNWKVARSPLQFAIENELLVDFEDKRIITATDVFTKKGLVNIESKVLGHCELNRSLAKSVFIKQLGDEFTTPEELTPVRQAILACFLAHGAGQKEEAIEVLYDIGASYKETDDIAPCVDLPTEKIKNFISAHKSLLEDVKALSIHKAFQLPLLMAALNFARKKGVLAGSQFLWLRPIDRPLWYALNQMGGKAAWAEAYAAWTHFFCEQKFNQSINVPYVDGAIEGLKNNLDAEGWLYEEPKPKEPHDASDSPELSEILKNKSTPEVSAETSPDKLPTGIYETASDDTITVTNKKGVRHKVYSSYD